MRVNVSINGVLRNFLQKFEYHYSEFYLNNESENKEEFEYGINTPIHTIKDFKFQSKDEMDVFMYLEFPLEIFGHAGLTVPSSVYELNKIIFESKKCTFTLIGLDELGKAKPSTLFFLSRNGFLGDNIKFINKCDIKEEWKNCDIWITDDKDIIDSCPITKECYKFNTQYNNHFTYKNEINNFKNIEELCLKFSELNTISTLMRLVKNALSNLKYVWKTNTKLTISEKKTLKTKGKIMKAKQS